MKRKRSRVLKLKQLFAGKTGLVLGGFALLVGGIYAFFFTGLFIVQNVQVQTSYKDINVERLQEALVPHAQGKNSLMLRMNTLEQQVYDAFPEVSSLSCFRDLFHHQIGCEALGYELVAVIKHQTEKYYINENGVVIAFDNRKLGLPIFDLILNPVFTEEITNPQPAETAPEPEPVAPVNQPVAPESLTASILQGRASGETAQPKTDPAILAEIADIEAETSSRLTFIQPQDAPAIEPVIRPDERDVFDVTVGKKLLAPDELQHILEAIKQLEEVLQRKVIQVQYVQVAGELSLTSRPQAKEELQNEEATATEDVPDTVPVTDEAQDHEFVVLLDLRRNLEDQFIKLKKSKEVIDFSEVSQIDLSIDGEKVFYR